MKLTPEMYTYKTLPDGRIISYCTTRQRVLHCVGLDYGKAYHRHGKAFYKPYRNYFTTNGPEKDWDELCKEGYADHGKVSKSGGITYWMTRAGLDWLGEQLEITIHDESD